MKRVKILVGSILATVSHGIASIVLLSYLLSVESIVSYYELSTGYGFIGEGILYAVLAIGAMVAITALILNVLSIRTWKQNKEVFKKSKGIIIAAIVFNFIVFSGLSIAAAILYIVDLAQEGKRIEGANTAVKSTAITTSTEKTLKTQDDKLVAADMLSNKLTKLDALKQSGILTEEEFNEIKKAYVKEYLDKK